VWAIVIIILLAILLGVYFWSGQEKKPVPQAQAPVTPAVAPAPPPAEPVKETVHFAFNKAILSAEDEAIVKAFSEKVTGKAGQITIEGHTCSIGPDWYNQNLSERRAERVVKLMGTTESGAASVQALGETRPVADNSTSKGRSANRRAELVFTPAR